MHRASSLLSTAALLALACTAAVAQTPSQNSPQGTPALPGLLSRQEQATPPAQRADQRIERIVVEDAGSRIDELRYGGQTQSITVQPKTASRLPGYQVQPDGQRVWNVLNF